MASTPPRHSSGGQSGFGLLLAIAAFAVSFFLWADAQAEETAPAPEGPVRLSETDEGWDFEAVTNRNRAPVRHAMLETRVRDRERRLW